MGYVVSSCPTIVDQLLASWTAQVFSWALLLSFSERSVEGNIGTPSYLMGEAMVSKCAFSPVWTHLLTVSSAVFQTRCDCWLWNPSRSPEVGKNSPHFRSSSSRMRLAMVVVCSSTPRLEQILKKLDTFQMFHIPQWCWAGRATKFDDFPS